MILTFISCAKSMNYISIMPTLNHLILYFHFEALCTVMLLSSALHTFRTFLNVRIYKTNFLVYQVLELFFTLNFTDQ